jgi:hypothetical protein
MKSATALLAAMAVATGLPILHSGTELVPTQMGPVLYGDWETTDDEQYERALALAPHFGLERVPDDLHYLSMTGSIADNIARVKAEVDRLGAVLFVVDSLGWACGTEPETAAAAIGTMNALRSLGPNVTRLCVAHVSHAGAQKRTGSAEIFGSRFWRQGARRTIEARAEEAEAGSNQAAVGLFQRKRNRGEFDKPIGLRFQFHPKGHALEELPHTVSRFDVRDSADLSQRLSLRERIIEALTMERMTAKQLAEHTDDPYNAVRARLAEMQKSGKVVRQGKVWALAEPERW